MKVKSLVVLGGLATAITSAIIFVPAGHADAIGATGAGCKESDS
jgi:hypothetical protein